MRKIRIYLSSLLICITGLLVLSGCDINNIIIHSEIVSSLADTAPSAPTNIADWNTAAGVIGETYKVTGTLSEIKRYESGDTLLAVRRTDDEISVFCPDEANIDILALSMDQEYTLTGVLTEYKGELELVVSSPDDITVQGDYEFEEVKVISVVDGDTVKIEDLAGNISKVRIIGVDCPETAKEGQSGEYYADQATEFTSQILLNQTVYLERDNSQTDQYDRLLRYIWLEIPENIDMTRISQLNFSALLLENGFAEFVSIGYDDKYENIFSEMETKSKEQSAGMWSSQ